MHAYSSSPPRSMKMNGAPGLSTRRASPSVAARCCSVRPASAPSDTCGTAAPARTCAVLADVGTHAHAAELRRAASARTLLACKLRQPACAVQWISANKCVTHPGASMLARKTRHSVHGAVGLEAQVGWRLRLGDGRHGRLRVPQGEARGGLHTSRDRRSRVLTPRDFLPRTHARVRPRQVSE
jgi:hypothetical protein